MAGPWFTVRKSGDDWKTLETIWLSDGTRNDAADVQLRVELLPPQAPSAHPPTAHASH